MEVLCIIPARGGSKGIKRKNLVEINNLPLITYSIKHALKSKYVTRVIVSTDDEEIAKVSLKFGAEVPFMRPKELAEDHVLDLPVFKHALNYLKETENYIPDFVLHLRPTAPYRKDNWIDECIDFFLNNEDADSLRSVSVPEKHPYRMFQIDDFGFLKSIMLHEHNQPYLLRRQDLPLVYFYNCVIDLTKPSTIFNLDSMTGNKILPYIMNAEEVFDIDTKQDLKIAELFFKKL